MISRLGILGGMFDPVHGGHTGAAKYARDYLRLDRLKMIPCYQPNHRESASASAHHRLNMLKLATANETALEVDEIEIERGGTSYAVDTMATIEQSGVAEQLVFVLGMDSFNTLPNWHQWQRLLDLCHLFVLGRLGARVSEAVAVQLELPMRQVDSVEQLFGAKSGRIFMANDFDYVASSTEIREKLQTGGDVAGLVDPEVLAYIRANNLYT